MVVLLPRILRKIWLPVAVLFIAACSPAIRVERNPYQLDLITDVQVYHKLVDQNPQMKMVDLEERIPGILLDVRYATGDNFTGEVIYTLPKAFLRQPVAHALAGVADSLSRLGLGLKIWDAYRPYAATLRFFEVYPDTNFVANPRVGSRHNRGCAVDVTLIDLVSGLELEMPTDFDDFSRQAHPTCTELSEAAIANRELLFGIMKHFGFSYYPTEWWHFDFAGWENFPLMDLAFEEL